MGKLFCLIGRSGVGKTTLMEEMCKRFPTLNTVLEYTTRPRRELEVDGIDHIFITEEEKDRMVANDEILAMFNIETVHGMWYYCVRRQDIDLVSNDYIMVTNPISLEQLKNVFGEDVIPIWIVTNEYKLYNRCMAREAWKNELQLKEINRRYIDDKRMYSDEVKSWLGIERTVDNTYLEEGIASVSDFIEQFLKIKR